jgi:hypothetical protein
MKQIKILGLLALAALVMSAFVGTAASTASKFTAGKVGAKLNESTVWSHTVSITGTNLSCSEITFAGSTEALEKETLTLKPTYSNCTAFGFNATVNTFGCSYTFSANGSVTLSGCAAGGITVTVSNAFAKCVAVIPHQTFIGVFYKNGFGLYIGFNSFLSDEVKESTGLCPLTVGKHSNASYTGESNMLAEGTYISWDA